MIRYVYLLAYTIVAFSGCTGSIDIGREKQNIRDILSQERKAHFDKNVDLFVSTFADSMISVHSGKTDRKSIDDYKKRFGPYFNRVTFSRWDDSKEPIIDISDDGSMAYAVVNKTVVLTYPDTLGKPFYDSTNYAWVSIYKKINGQWKGVCNASTQD